MYKLKYLNSSNPHRKPLTQGLHYPHFTEEETKVTKCSLVEPELT